MTPTLDGKRPVRAPAPPKNVRLMLTGRREEETIRGHVLKVKGKRVYGEDGLLVHERRHRHIHICTHVDHSRYPGEKLREIRKNHH